MSDFTGVTFANQKVTPSDDGIVRSAILTDGVLQGCALSYVGSTLTMASGHLLIKGRQVGHPAAQNWAVTGATSGYARLVLTVDLTQASTKDTFSQVSSSIEYATAADGFAALSSGDINGSGTKYAIEVCVVSLAVGGITGIVSQIGEVELSARYVDKGTYSGDVNVLGNKGVRINSVVWTTPSTTGLPVTGAGVYGILETWASNAGIVLQRITYTSGKAYERMYYNSAWKEWIRTDNGAITRETLEAAPKINIGTYAGDLNSLTDIPLNSIAWIVAGTCTNCPTGNYAILETWGTSTRMQRLTTVSGPAAQRIYVNGSWTEWEWLNAPMTIGVEYRTTERWNTQPVYTRIVNCGTLVEGRKLTTVAALAGCKIFEAKGYAVNATKGTSYLIPSIYETTDATTSLVMLVNTGGTSGDIQIFAGSEHAGTTAYVMLKYIKS